jgi:ketosteroid isomerase-like protein
MTALAGPVSPAAPATPGADRGRIAALEQHWLAAIRNRDHHALESILADGFTDITVTGEKRGRREAIALAVAPADTTQTIIQLDVRVFDNTAIATGINQVHSRTQGWTAEVAFTDVFIREHGDWRAISAQETLRKPAPAATTP